MLFVHLWSELSFLGDVLLSNLPQKSTCTNYVVWNQDEAVDQGHSGNKYELLIEFNHGVALGAVSK